MGLGEGVAFPAIHSIIARSVPTDKQSTFGLAPAII